MSPQQVILKVEGMNCSHCSGTVHKALEAIDGIDGVTVDLEGKKATFNVTGREKIAEAKSAITKAGFTPSE